MPNTLLTLTWRLRHAHEYAAQVRRTGLAYLTCFPRVAWETTGLHDVSVRVQYLELYRRDEGLLVTLQQLLKLRHDISRHKRTPPLQASNKRHVLSTDLTRRPEAEER